MEQLTQEQAIELADSAVWRDWSDEEVVAFQLYQKCLCMDWAHFHGAIERVLGRPVWTHEFARPELLRAEYEGKRGKPSFTEITELLPQGKEVIIVMALGNR